MNQLFIGTQELFILAPLVYGLFILAIFYGLYEVLTILQNLGLTAKCEHTATLLIQSVALNEISRAIRESNKRNSAAQEII